MKQALIEAREWPSHLKIAVNVSPIQFRDPHLAERILKLLAETQLSAFAARSRNHRNLRSSKTGNRRVNIVESLKNMGVTISLDDFGTGYASLSQLQSLPFDRIKIDKSFVTSLLSNPQNDAIVGTILSLGRALQLPITAEGIEDDGTRDRLRLLGCSDGQGWLFGKPVSGDAIRATFGIASTPEIPSVALTRHREPGTKRPKAPRGRQARSADRGVDARRQCAGVRTRTRRRRVRFAPRRARRVGAASAAGAGSRP